MDVRDPNALAARLAEFSSLPLAVAHELAQPLNVIITNATMASEDLARLRSRFTPDDPLAAELEELAAAQADVLAAAERIATLAAALRAMP